MIEQLRIQCPECRIVLDVRNSKHEAVKRITCPNCKKQLAIDFQEDEKPAVPAKPLGALYYGQLRISLQEGVNTIQLPGCEFVEIRVVRLNDGNNKTIVRSLDDAHPVKVNGECLAKDDEVALADGDEIQIDETVLVYNQPGKTVTKDKLSEKKTKPDKPDAPKRNYAQWMLFVVASALVISVICILNPFKTKPPKPQPQKVEHFDSVEVAEQPKVKKTEPAKPTAKGKKEDVAKQPQAPKASTPSSSYELEQQAMKGNVDAQYELGNRLVHSNGISSIIRGLNYLNMAARNGSSKAQQVRQKAVSALRQKAERGDSIAIHILGSIN